MHSIPLVSYPSKPRHQYRLILIGLMVLLLTAGAVYAAPRQTIRIGVEGAYPPFSRTMPDGSLAGFDIDIAHALCREMKVDCKLVAQDWDGIIPALLARKYDAIIASVSITEHRRQKVAFTRKYYQTPARLVAHHNFVLRLLKGEQWRKSVGVQRATTHDAYLTENFGTQLIIRRYGTLDEACLDLQAGRIDLVLGDSIALRYGFLKTAGRKDYQFIGPELTDPRWFGDGIGIALRLEDTELVERFNAAIDAIRANGVYREIQDRYFDFDIYGEE